MGDPGIRALRPSVLITGWNFCNEALAPPGWPTSPSPRWADCAGVLPSDNALGPGDAFPLPGFNATPDVNAYAVEKELFLAARCAQPSQPGGPPGAWAFHTVMLKTGNMDPAAGLCPSTNPPGAPLGFNNLPMVQPEVALTPATLQPVPYGGKGYVGSVGATYDVSQNWTAAERAAVRAALASYTAAWTAYRFAEVDGAPPLPPAPAPPALLANKSYEAAIWWRNVSSGGTVFHHIQASSAAAPWLMNYYKLMDTQGVGGGYDWQGAGQLFGPIPSYKSQLTVAFTQLTTSNLYLPCHGGCWKLSGAPCDGGAAGGSNDDDVTRYICFKINGGAPCRGAACPLYHVRSSDGKRVPRGDPAFPAECYAMHCGPGGNNVSGCDPYSNPGPQELMMLNPCAEWAIHGYPAEAGGGSGAGPRTFDVGALGARVALVGAEPADVGEAARLARGWAPLPPLSQLPPYPGWTRSWVGFDFGTEQFSPAANRYEFSDVDLQVLARE